MMAKEGFYVQVLSNSNESEYPNNRPNHFKNRLPYPLRLPEREWQVGLSSISLPDTTLNLTKLESLTYPILSVRCLTSADSSTDSFTTSITFDEIRNSDNIVDGITFMKALINKYNQDLFSAIRGGGTVLHGDKKIAFTFRWEDDELILDNNQMDLEKVTHDRNPYKLTFAKSLAVEMGWIKKDRRVSEGYTIGPNLLTELLGNYKPLPSDLGSLLHYPNFFEVKNGTVHLSCFVNWRFVNLNVAFHSVVGNTARSLLVYSNVGGSSVVGNQVTDLLREVKFERTSKGINYFEPLHIRYLPVRNHTIDIIETQVSETNGDLTRFSEGETIVTLHFKRT